MWTADSLLIDIGNTSAKLRPASRNKLLGKTRVFPTALLREESSNAVAELFVSEPHFLRCRRVVLCSVIPAATGRVLAALPEDAEVLVVRSGTHGAGVDLSAYRQRRTLGVDRLANMAGALVRHGGTRPLIVVDFGTTATFNVLDANGRFLGGVIAPGLDNPRHYFATRTPRLPPLGRLRLPVTATGKSTRAAMLAGSALGCRGSVREIIASLLEETPNAKVIATGGDARLAVSLLPDSINVADPELTLHGLRIIGAGGAKFTAVSSLR